MSKPTIGFLGAGNMAEALIRGLVESTAPIADKVIASAPRPERLQELADRYGISTTTDNSGLVEKSDIVVLAVKPQVLTSVLDEIRPADPQKRLYISVAAGVSTAHIEASLGDGARVVRAMPNTPALVSTGATALSKGANVNDGDLEQATAIFNAVGISEVLSERQLNAVTGLSGSGPAYIFLVLEALADAGVKVGLSRRHAQRLSAQTVMGAAKLLLETDLHPGQLKDMVTSPGGTAIAGLHTLEEGGLRTTLINAVESATRRAEELGDRGDQ